MVDFAQLKLDELGYAWWVAGCATGKTLSALALAAETGARRTLVMTKKTVIGQAWGGNAERFTEGFSVLPLTKGSTADKTQAMRDHWNDPSLVVVGNYETLAIIAQTLGRLPKFDLVVADESHRLKTNSSKQSKALALGAAHIPMKVAMTGTPFDDRPTDVYGQVRWLAGAKKGAAGSVQSEVLGSWTGFFEKYVVYRQQDNIKIPIRYKNQDELRSILSPFTMYLDSEEVLDLPPEQDIDWEVEWTPELKRIYRDMEVDMLSQFDGGVMVADNALVQGLRLHQLTGGYFAGETGGYYVATPKVDATLDILDEIGGQPTVIFTVFESDVQALKPALEAAGHSVKLLIGGTYQHEEFQSGDGDVIIVNLAAGNEGIELTRARYGIYYSIGNSRSVYRQSRYRIRRPTSAIGLPISYFHLILPKSVDEDMRKAMVGKGEVSDYLIAGLKNRVRK